MSRVNLLSAIGLIWAVCLLQACVAPVRVIPPIDADSSLGPDEGVVAVRLADTSPGTRFPYNYVTFAPKDLNQNDSTRKQRIKKEPEGAITSGTMIAPLAAGQYSVADLMAYYQITPERFYRDFMDASPEFGTFRVEPGRLTNLGTIIYYPRYDGENFAKTLARNDSFSDAQAHIKRKYGNVYTNLTNPKDALSWDRSDFDDEQWEKYVRAAQNPVAFDAAFERSNGDIVFLSRLGVIVDRRGDGQWRLDSVPMDIQLTAYDENRHGARVAAGEFGAVFVKQATDNEWNRLESPVPGALIQFAFMSDEGRTVVGIKREKKLDVYGTDGPDAGKWNKLGWYITSSGWTWFGLDGESESNKPRKARPTRGKLGHVDGFRNGKQPTIVVDEKLFQLVGGMKRIEHVDSGVAVQGLEKAGDHLFGFDKNWWGNSGEIVVSFDGGQNWEELSDSVRNCEPPSNPRLELRYCDTDPKIMPKSSFRLSGAPHFWDRQHGYVFATVVHKHTDNERLLLETRDGGQSWSKVQSDELPEHCGKLIPAIGSERLLLQCYSGYFYLSEDGGRHWRIDREPSTL